MSTRVQQEEVEKGEGKVFEKVELSTSQFIYTDDIYKCMYGLMAAFYNSTFTQFYWCTLLYTAAVQSNPVIMNTSTYTA